MIHIELYKKIFFMNKTIFYLFFLLLPLIIFSSDIQNNTVQSLKQIYFDACKNIIAEGKDRENNDLPFKYFEKILISYKNQNTEMNFLIY